MMIFKAIYFVHFILNSTHWLLKKAGVTVQENRNKGTRTRRKVCTGSTFPILVRGSRVGLFLEYCLPKLFNYKIRYSPSWSTEVKKMHRSVYLESKLINTDSNHNPWPDILSHVTNKAASLTDLVRLTMDNQPIPSSTLKFLDAGFNGADRIYGVMNLALAQRQRRDFIGLRTPLAPLWLKAGANEPVPVSKHFVNLLKLENRKTGQRSQLCKNL